MVLIIRVVACSALLTGCSWGAVEGRPEIRARLDEQILGQPESAIVKAAGPAIIQRNTADNGSQQITLVQAERDRHSGATLSCRESMTVSNSQVTSYRRDGNGC
ncbi:hypothetical protein [Oleisolibacter albus]|uniref:hypothetical protein n=1 Tax=Oleisolibacter albus TaxID=2171757 RepID=UPI001960C92B|nr:hypothetical protein [Oleisolibacter albus]